jgi:hypothetical protein
MIPSNGNLADRSFPIFGFQSSIKLTAERGGADDVALDIQPVDANGA